MEPICDQDEVLAFGLDRQHWIGDQSFEDALMLAVTGEERLVGEQEDAVAQVGIEVAGEVFGVADIDAVLSPGFSEALKEYSFAAAFCSADYDGDFALAARLLEHEGGPIHQVFEVFLDAAAEHRLDVIVHIGPIAGRRGEGEPAPQVYKSGWRGVVWVEDDAGKILAARGVVEP